MKEAVSPFAAMTTKERLEQWNCWHSQHQAEISVKKEPTEDDRRSESVLSSAKPTESRAGMKPHHSQYDAVVKRMRMASFGARVFQPCSEESTRQDSSGSP